MRYKPLFWTLLLIALLTTASSLVQAQAEAEPACIEVFEISLPYERAVEGRISWSPDGRYAAQVYTVVDQYGTAVQEHLLVLDVSSWNTVMDFEREVGASFSDEIVWPSTGERLAVAVRNVGRVEIIEVAGWDRHVLSYVEDANAEVTQQLIWSEDGRELMIVSANRDEVADVQAPAALATTVRLWAVTNNRLETLYEGLQQARVSRHEGQWYVALRERGSEGVDVYRLGDDAPLLELENAYLVDLASMTDQLLLASVEFESQLLEDATLRVWGVESGQEIYHLDGRGFYLSDSSLIAHTELLIAKLSATDWLVYNLKDGVSISLEEQVGLLPSPDGSFVAALDRGIGGSTAVTLREYAFITNTSTGEIVARIPLQGSSGRVVWSLNSLSLIMRNSPTTLGIYSFADCPMFNP